jgi:outer membrane protein assembly factor BamB
MSSLRKWSLRCATIGLIVGTQAYALKVPNENSGGGLKTDAELDLLLQRAEQFAANKRYDLASELWQKVIDDSNDTVMTKPEWVQESLNHLYKTYKPVQDEIEKTLSTLPPEALKVYRLRADGEATAVMAAARSQDQYETALGEVVRRYFLSSHGDDAANELAGLHMDRYEFLPALRLINKVLSSYPDPDVSKSELLARMTVALGKSGNLDAAREAMEQLKAEPNATVAPALVRWVDEDLGKDSSAGVIAGNAAQEWIMPFGNAERSGLAPNISLKTASTNGLQLAWKQGFVLTLPAELEGITKQKEDIEEKVQPLLDAWKATSWMPTGQVVLRDERIYFKKDDRLVCLKAADGQVEWMGFRNGFAVDAVSKQLRQFGNRSFSTTKKETTGPLDPVTIQSFNDHVSQSMIYSDNKIITLEGKPLDLTATESVDGNARFAWSRGSPTRSRDNWMVAYHAINGKLRWYRTAGEKGAENAESACFLGAPVPYGSTLFTTVLDKNSLWLYALDQASGETIWKKFLCDEEPGAVSRFSAPAIAISGGEIYVSSGAGLVFGMDAVSGVLRWCVRYPRSVDPKSSNSYYYTQARKLHGWDADTVLPQGNQVLVLASDFDQLLSLDRSTGELMWESAKVPSRNDPACEYCLGVWGDRIIVAGRKMVRAYKVDGGRMLWEVPVDTYARGLLTEESIYLPGAAELIELDPETGNVRRTVKVETVDDQPLGNLYTEGKRLYAIGLRRVYCFESNP